MYSFVLKTRRNAVRPLLARQSVVGNRLKARCGRLLRRCNCATPLLEVIKSTAACHGVL